MAGTETSQLYPVLAWIHSGDLVVDWALPGGCAHSVMLVVVTTVSALVHLYSWGYMAEDDSQPRFFAYLSLFTFAMLMLVTADNLVQMFFGWEGVGLASYLLIGFWYHKPSANAAAMKAFVVNRSATSASASASSAPSWCSAPSRSPTSRRRARHGGSTIGFLGGRVDTMTLLCILLFIGAMGKSAQLGLHTWLPDAMEGRRRSRADPRRDDGHRRRVHGLPPVADVRDQRHRARHRHLRRRRHRDLRRHRRPRSRTTSSG
jgi:NADH-quinone oxidoreductase subunit L